MLQIALGWILAQPGVTSAIVGARTVEQLDENLAAAELVLEPDEIARLDAATALEPTYPTTIDRQWGFLEPGASDGSSSR